MRPASNSTAAAAGAGFQHWNSPPFHYYLFGGVAVILVLVAMALVILACSYKKTPSDSLGEADEEKLAKRVSMQLEMEPKFVVIMAGDENPTYLANPVSSTRHHGHF